MDYEIIDIPLSFNLKEMILCLREYHYSGRKVKTEFNGHWLYSDKVDLENTYKELTGKTYTEYQQFLKDEHDRYIKEEAEHKAKIPELTKKYIEEGRKVIAKKYWKLWDECVPIRLDDIYRGWELDCCLDIIKALNENKSFKEIQKIFGEQEHSGMSAGLLKSMLYSFHDKGKELIKTL